MEIKVNSPRISEETYTEMKKFFLKTSIPRILKEREENERTNRNSLHIKR
jgi:hypothetical protein